MRRRRTVRVFFRYARLILRDFRWTLLALAVAVLVGTVAFSIAPSSQFNNQPPPLPVAAFAAWMALFAQQPLWLPTPWYILLIGAIYPLFGFVLIGEGIIRVAVLILSRKRGEKEWMKLMAATYRDHVILCGLGHLGFRILDHLLQKKIEVVAIEKNEYGRFVAEAKATGAAVLIRDMKEDQALVDAGIAHARCIVIAANDDMVNLEVALDSRRMNPKIHIIMRLFDQSIANKLKEAKLIDEAFSAAALAAPVVAEMTTRAAKIEP